MSTATERLTRGPASTIRALVLADGTAAAPHARALGGPAAALRDVADAVHALCVVHGAFPGLVDLARSGCGDAAVRDWLDDAVATVATERALLARLTAAVGPLPSTPGQAASETAVLGQRHALEMLARSDREGCAAGTAIAFVLDWVAIRRLLDVCAMRLGIIPPAGFDRLATATDRLLDTLDVPSSTERAMGFGAQQMLAQHRGLWHLLEARASARSGM